MFELMVGALTQVARGIGLGRLEEEKHCPKMGQPSGGPSGGPGGGALGPVGGPPSGGVSGGVAPGTVFSAPRGDAVSSVNVLFGDSGWDWGLGYWPDWNWPRYYGPVKVVCERSEEDEELMECRELPIRQPVVWTFGPPSWWA